MRSPQTMFDKVWRDHVVADLGGGSFLLHVDRHMLHELSPPVAFSNMRRLGRKVRTPRLNIGVQDHVVSTRPGRSGGMEAQHNRLIDAHRQNCRDFGLELIDLDDPRQGIVHIITPELGIATPGMTVVCGDSHTCTIGGLGALAWGIGTSEIEHVLCSQTIVQGKPKRMRVRFDGQLGAHITAKDMMLYLMGQHTANGGTGYAVEYAGSTVRGHSMEARLTLCNLSVEFGGRIGFVAPDDVTYEYLQGRPFTPQGGQWDQALAYWKTLPGDEGALFEKEVTIDAAAITPQITWGTSPEHVIGIDECIPNPSRVDDPIRREAFVRALKYMGFEPGTPMAGLKIDAVFIGSCTNSRLSDIRAAAAVVKGRKVAPGVRAMVVPGSQQVRNAAHAEGLDRIFLDAGFEWHEPGCSMCASANGERVAPGAHCVSTSNRNFEGRQGPGSRTHLASPVTAAAAAVTGQIIDARQLLG